MPPTPGRRNLSKARGLGKGDRVVAVIRGNLNAKPNLNQADPSAQVVVDGHDDWWAVVPAETLIPEDEYDNRQEQP